MARIRRIRLIWTVLVLIILLSAGYYLTTHYMTWKNSRPAFNAAGDPVSSVAGGGPTAGMLSRPVSSGDTDEIRTVRVSTVEELFAAIGSNTTIELAPGVYDISPFITKLWEDDGNAPSRVHHSFGYVRAAFDEPEVVIWPVVNLTIRGTGKDLDAVTIVSKYPDANVLTFSHCKNVTLSNLTVSTVPDAGYSGEADGSLLCFESCADVVLDSVDLATSQSRELTVRSAEGNWSFTGTRFGNAQKDGHFSVTDSRAAFRFDRCGFEGPAENVFSLNFPTAEMVFSGCAFDGAWNARRWLERDNVFFTGCTFSGEPLETDLSARADRFDPTPYWTSFFSADDLNNTKWRGVLMQYTDTAAAHSLPYTDPDSGFVYDVTVEFRDDGTGVFEWYNAPEAGPFEWRVVTMKEASFPGVTVEMFELSDPGAPKMLRLWIENVMIWMEPAE